MRQIAAFLLGIVVLASCSPQTPSVNEQIQQAVRETLAAMPTETPAPTPALLPTATEVQLMGIFCEYQFCIGHPNDLAFYDVIAKQNPSSPAASRYDDGILAANNSNLFIEVIWQNAPAGADPQFLLGTILDSRVDTRGNTLEPLSVGSLTAIYVPVQSTATGLLPYGGASAWTCGGRAFAWKAYTAQPDLAKNLLIEALHAFRCNS